MLLLASYSGFVKRKKGLVQKIEVDIQFCTILDGMELRAEKEEEVPRECNARGVEMKLGIGEAGIDPSLFFQWSQWKCHLADTSRRGL